LKPETEKLNKQYNDLLKQGRIDGDKVNPVMKNYYDPDMKRRRLQIEANEALIEFFRVKLHALQMLSK